MTASSVSFLLFFQTFVYWQHYSWHSNTLVSTMAFSSSFLLRVFTLYLIQKGSMALSFVNWKHSSSSRIFFSLWNRTKIQLWTYCFKIEHLWLALPFGTCSHSLLTLHLFVLKRSLHASWEQIWWEKKNARNATINAKQTH